MAEENAPASPALTHNLKPAEDNIYYKLAMQGKEIWNRWVISELSDAERRKFGVTNSIVLSPEEKTDFAYLFWPQGLPVLRDVDFSYIKFTRDVDFSGFYFPENLSTENQHHLFRGAIFGGAANFSTAIFLGQADFTSAIFEKSSNFSSTTFEGDARFDFAIYLSSADYLNAAFKKSVNFESASFAGLTIFERATLMKAKFRSAKFNGVANFISANFVEYSDFDLVKFYKLANFTSATYHEVGSFNAAIFSQVASFESTRFRSMPQFSLTSFEYLVSFSSALFEKGALFLGTKFDSYVDFSGASPCNFGGVMDFRRSSFGGVSFNNREFVNSANFSWSTFATAPLFYNSRLHQDTTFYEASFDPIFDDAAINSESVERAQLAPKHIGNKDVEKLIIERWDSAARAFRTIALAMKDLNAHDEELRFFALEMRAKEYVESGAKRFLIKAYRLLGDFGRSIEIPAVRFIQVTLGALLINLFSVFLSTKNYCWNAPRAWDECNVWIQTLNTAAFTFSSSVPFLGQARFAADMAKELFAPSALGLIYFVSVIQGLASALFLFLIGLALRNRFRIK